MFDLRRGRGQQSLGPLQERASPLPAARRGARRRTGRRGLAPPSASARESACACSLGAASTVSRRRQRVGEGRSFAAAFRPLADDLLRAFRLVERLRQRRAVSGSISSARRRLAQKKFFINTVVDQEPE